MTAKKKYSNSNVSHLRFVNKNLRNANFQDAICCRTDFSNCNLKNANFQNANLTQANLNNADLSGADLSGSDLSNAYLKGAKLENAKLPKFQIPQSKSLIVYKKLEAQKYGRPCIAKLRIPARAKRTATLVGDKCRAEYAIVEAIYYLDDGRRCGRLKKAVSLYNPEFVYEVGKKVWARSYSDDIRIECAGGIHFFMTEREALDYQ